MKSEAVWPRYVPQNIHLFLLNTESVIRNNLRIATYSNTVFCPVKFLIAVIRDNYMLRVDC